MILAKNSISNKERSGMVAIRFTIIFNAKILLNFIACYDGIDKN
jgi:hypothetical protein